jgi:hypothetical protein
VSEIGKAFPALILGYQRIDEAYAVALAAINSKVSSLYLSLDGSKNPDLLLRQDELIRNIAELCSMNNTPFYFKKIKDNLGLKRAVISGIDWFFETNEHGHIFEDDLKISPYYFEFVQTAFEKFTQSEQILLISGNQFIPELDSNDIQLSSYPLVWGWFTSGKKWKIIKDLINDQHIGPKEHLKWNVNYFWKIGAMKSTEGLSNSWAIPFAYGMRKFGFKCLLPSTNLISNLGVDTYASHTRSSNIENSFPINYEKASEMLLTFDTWNYQFQDPAFLEKKVYRIKFKHGFLFLKIWYLQYKFNRHKKFFERKQKNSSD